MGKGTGYCAFFSLGGFLGQQLDARLSATYPKWFKRADGKSKLKSIAEEIKDIDKFWNDFVYTICKGDPVEMREVVKFDIFDFFAFVENKSRK